MAISNASTARKAAIVARAAANRDARAASQGNQQTSGVGPIQGGATGGMGGGPISAGPGALPPYVQGGATGGMGGGPISAGPGAPLPAGGGGMPAPGTSGMSTAPLPPGATYKKGGKAKVKKMASGGMTSNLSSASKRADGIAQRGKTKCKMY